MSCSIPNQEENPILENELKALVADIEVRSKRLVLSNLVKALEVVNHNWGINHDDYVVALTNWSSDMGREARSHLAYHLKRIGLPLLGQK